MALRDAVSRWLGRRRLHVWHHPAYRLPMARLHEQNGMDPRRADLALWALQHVLGSDGFDLREPVPASFSELSRVHTPEHLRSLTEPRALSHVFGLDTDAFPVDAVLHSVRLATGGTIAATREALRSGEPCLNLLGGFHHAHPQRGGGYCPVNDLAIALAIVRDEGFTGQVVVIDLDAHPPDGTAACLRDDARAWIGSISGSDWGPLPTVHEVVLRRDDTDDTYLEALRDLRDAAPRPDLAFVIAGGDVLHTDPQGNLGLTLAGARRRDRLVARWLHDVPSVWLPGGGYSPDAWRVLLGTACVLAGASSRLPDGFDPLTHHYERVASRLDPHQLGHSHEPLFSQEEVDSLFGVGPAPPTRFLGYYTAAGLEHALYAYGLLPQLRRLGYTDFDVQIGRGTVGDTLRLTAADPKSGNRHLLVEAVLQVETWRDERWLYVHWLNLRHPLGTWEHDRPQLPGQEVPGLGLASETGALLLQLSRRLHLAGLLLRPAWFHVAWMSRGSLGFADPLRQGELEAIERDLGHLPLRNLTVAVAEGRLLRNGAPWTWTPEVMTGPQPAVRPDAEQVQAARDAAHFTLAEPG